jgi:hypothetical protein
MKKILGLLSILLLSFSGLANAAPTKAYTVLEAWGEVAKHDPVSVLFDAGPQSVWGWYDAQNLSKNKSVDVDVFDCVKKTCSGNSGWKLVSVLTSGESYTFKGAYNTAKGISDDWKFVVVDTSNKIADFKFKVSAVPELETWALMLLGVMVMVLKVRPRKSNELLH